MELRQKYREAFDELDEMLQEKMENGRYPALGLTSNLDFLCDFQIGRLNELLEEYMTGKDLSEMHRSPLVTTTEEMLETIVDFCAHGIGGEVDMEDMEIAKQHFPYTLGMGGTGVQAAMALNEIGCPSIVHLTDDSPEVCEILDTPYIFTVSGQGELVHTTGFAQTNEQEPHFIIQFTKGDVIRLGDQTLEIPRSNRLIFTKITVNEYVPFSKPYFTWIEQNAKKVSSEVLSSFNCILDPEVLKSRIASARVHVEAYRRNNPDGIVFFEDAHFHDMDIKRLCLEEIGPYSDIVSMNEEELDFTLNTIYKHGVDIDDIFSCIAGAEFLRDKLGVQKGIVIHTKDYSAYIGKPLAADIEKGLMYGNMLATAKASVGWYGNRSQVKEVLDLDFSETGKKHYNAVKASKYAAKVTLVPSCYIDRPRYTIGLGDTFVGGVQMCF